MREKRLFVDMDGTIAVFDKGAPLERIQKEGYFKNRPLMNNVIEAIKLIVNKGTVEVFILSSVFEDNHSVADKNYWLNNNLPEIDEEHRIFNPISKNKTESIKGKITSEDYLLDDFSFNLHRWTGTGIKVLNGINGSHKTWKGLCIDASWDKEDIASILLKYMEVAA